jgi:hypothetical protein
MILTEEQLQFISELRAWHKKPSVKAINVQAKAGSGKTTCITKYAEELEPEAVIFIAPTHAALVQLRQRTEGLQAKFLTVAKALSSFPVVSTHKVETTFASFGGKPFDENALIIVDESSMLSDQEVIQLISLSTKIIFSGDINQLAPVKKKSGHSELIKLPQLTLTKMMRADSQELIKVGLTALNYTQYIPETTEDNSVIKHDTIESFQAEFLKQVAEPDCKPGDCVWITRTNEEVQKINALAHYTVTNRKTLEPGDTVRLYANSKLGNNNTLAVIKTVEALPGVGTLLVSTEPEDGTKYKVEVALPDRYVLIKQRIEAIVKLFQSDQGNEAYERELKTLRSIVEIDFPYAITTHKSQGASIPFVFANSLKLHGRKAFYVAYSRASKQLHVVAKKFKKAMPAENSIWYNEKLNCEIKAPYLNVAEVKAEIEHIYGKEIAPSISHLMCVLNPSHASKTAKGWALVSNLKEEEV